MAIGLTIQELCFLDNGPYSLSITPGECVGLTGISGVGKTQFLRAVADIIPHQGSLALDGVECNSIAPYEWRKQLSMLPAESRWWYDIVRQHFPEDYMQEFGFKWLKVLGFPDDVMEWQISRLSTGEKQRLSLLRAMINQPRMLLLDEPTSSLDHYHTTELEKFLFQCRQQQQIGLIWISHDLEQLRRVSDRIYSLEKNELRGLS